MSESGHCGHQGTPLRAFLHLFFFLTLHAQFPILPILYCSIFDVCLRQQLSVIVVPSRQVVVPREGRTEGGVIVPPTALG